MTKTLDEKVTQKNVDSDRLKFIAMDSKRSYFWKLLMLFYETFVIKTADFELYPYLSTQLSNVIACSIAKHAADQHEDYFGSSDLNNDGSDHGVNKTIASNREPQKELVCLAFCKYISEDLLPQFPVQMSTSITAVPQPFVKAQTIQTVIDA